MPDAASSFLNQSPRSQQQARDARVQPEQERRQRLERHGSDFCHRVLAGAFERIYQADGSFRLREIQSGIWLEDLPLDGVTDAPGFPPSPLANAAAPQSESRPGRRPSAMPPGSPAAMIEAAQRLGYARALRELAHWISAVATQSRIDARTLAALNEQLSQMSGSGRTAMTMVKTRQMP